MLRYCLGLCFGVCKFEREKVFILYTYAYTFIIHGVYLIFLYSYIALWENADKELRLKEAKVIFELSEYSHFTECALCIRRSEVSNSFVSVGLSLERLQLWEINCVGNDKESLDYRNMPLLGRCSKLLVVSDPYLTGRLYIAVVQEDSILVFSESLRVLYKIDSDLMAQSGMLLNNAAKFFENIEQMKFSSDSSLIVMTCDGVISVI